MCMTSDCLAWMPHTSNEIMVADGLSNFFYFSEYKLSPRDFEMLCQRFGPLSGSVC